MARGMSAKGAEYESQGQVPIYRDVAPGGHRNLRSRPEGPKLYPALSGLR